MDPRHVRVSQFAAPTPDEKRHQFLWRFWPELPGWGGMAVFDRSWYGRVLVERVEGFAEREEWLRAYDEIFNFEGALADDGMILVKFWMHVSPRGAARSGSRRGRTNPLKAWKLTDEDWRNREKRGRVRGGGRGHARQRTHQEPFARWHVIAGGLEEYARVQVLETVIAEIEEGMRRHGMEPPPPHEA